MHLISIYKLESTNAAYLKSPSSLIYIMSKFHMHFWMGNDGGNDELSCGRIDLRPRACHEVDQVWWATVGGEENCIVGRQVHVHGEPSIITGLIRSNSEIV